MRIARAANFYTFFPLKAAKQLITNRPRTYKDERKTVFTSSAENYQKGAAM